jgi:hypothetical protein
MDTQYGVTCSSINLRVAPDLKSSVIHALRPQERVVVLEEAGDMLKVQATRLHPPIVGYAQRSGVILGGRKPEVFPRVQVKPWLEIPSVPASLPLATFLAWLDSGKESPWLPADYVAAIESGERPSVGKLIRQVVADHRPDWDGWMGEVQGQGRMASATLDEWLVMTAGGRTMWSYRPERLFAEASEHSAALGWVVPQDVLLWTGQVRFNDGEPKYKCWYQVEFTKLDRQLRGWYKASLLEEFILPTAFTDLVDPDNRQTAFDLSRSRLRMPADPEIDAARAAGRTGAQYIEISRAIGSLAIKYNLCGELCAAALVGSDIIPFLQQWLAGYPRAKPILTQDDGTSIQDLQSMLDLPGRKYEYFRAEASVAPITPGYVRRMLDSGRMAIVGTGITYTGVVKWNSHIRHWIIIEDIVRVGNSGWLRIYNPFPACEEVYPFDVVFDSVAASAMGLWVEPVFPCS